MKIKILSPRETADQIVKVNLPKDSSRLIDKMIDCEIEDLQTFEAPNGGEPLDDDPDEDDEEDEIIE